MVRTHHLRGTDGDCCCADPVRMRLCGVGVVSKQEDAVKAILVKYSSPDYTQTIAVTADLEREFVNLLENAQREVNMMH